MSRDTFLAGVRASLVAGPDDRVLRRAVLDRIRATVPFDGFAWLLTDPVTTVGTGPLAEVPCPDRLPRLVGLRYTSGRRWTAGDPVAPFRPVVPGTALADFVSGLGSYDIVSTTFADRYGCWGFLDLWREGGRFTAEELDLLRLVRSDVTTALRSSCAAGLGIVAPERPPPTTRSVLLLDGDLSLRRQTPHADEALRALLPTEESRRPVPAAAYNVGAQLLAVEAGVDGHPAAARAIAAPGRWISVEAARLGDEIAVTIGPLDPLGRTELCSRAFGLTPRETSVLERLSAGDDTRHAARHLGVSENTVQDHLKSVFAKTGARSRGELLALARGA